jgi:hypothetical protein
MWQMANQGPKTGECGHFRRLDESQGDHLKKSYSPSKTGFRSQKKEIAITLEKVTVGTLH